MFYNSILGLTFSSEQNWLSHHLLQHIFSQDPSVQEMIKQNLCDLQQPTRCFRLSQDSSSPHVFPKDLLQDTAHPKARRKGPWLTRLDGSLQDPWNCRSGHDLEVPVSGGGSCPSSQPQRTWEARCAHVDGMGCAGPGDRTSEHPPAWPRALGSSALPGSKVRCLLLRR